MELSERDKFLAKSAMRQTADMIAAELERMAKDPMMKKVNGQQALIAAAAAARRTTDKVWPEGRA